MEKMRVVMADDDFSSRFLLSQFAQLLPDYEVVGEAADGEELIHLVMKEKPDIALVDIHMPSVNGVEAVKACKEISPSLQIIFTTGSDEHAVDAFNISAVDYIVKPIEKARLFVALEKAKKNIQLEKPHHQTKRINANKLSIRSNNSFVYLSIEDILFIEKVGRKALINTDNQKYETTDSLQELEDRLPPYFFKTHRSYLVNLRRIEKIESSGETYLAYFGSNDDVAYISKLKINEVYGLLQN